MPLKNSSPFSVPAMLFSELCIKWCATNSVAEGGVKRKRREHIINPAMCCIPASHADPHEHTGAGFSLLPPCASWQAHACSPAAPMVPGWPKCFHWKGGEEQPQYWGKWGSYFEVQDTKRLYWMSPSFSLCCIFLSFGKAEDVQPRALTFCKLWFFMLLWVSLIFQVCLLDSLYYWEFKSKGRENILYQTKILFLQFWLLHLTW